MSRPSLERWVREMRRQVIAGMAIAVALIGGIGGWAVSANIAGAVIATGQIVVVSDVKRVQHPTGGVVSEILVHEGDRVAQGQILIRLDDTATRANLGVITAMLDELLGRRSRLRSERDGKESIDFVPELLARRGEPAVSEIIASEQRLFQLRRAARDGNKAGLNERLGQLKQEITGLEEQIASKQKELELIQSELGATRELWEKQLVQRSRYVAIEREAVRIRGLASDLSSRIAETRGRIAEIELQILQIERDFNSEVARELREADAKINELNERRIAAEDQLRRIDIPAPVTGAVHQLAVHTVGGVIAPGEVLMSIVPTEDKLQVEAAVRPSDVDQLQVGAPATLRLSAFNQRSTPEIQAQLDWVSPNVSVHERTGESFYEIRVSIDKNEAVRASGLDIIPGMPVEVFVKTSDRRAISLLVKPLTDQLHRAFRED